MAGLYTLRAQKLIELSVAAADGRPTEKIEEFTMRGPRAGYWYLALRHVGETAPGPDRFAFSAYPDTYPAAGRLTFIVDEKGVVWKKEMGGVSPEFFPADPERDGWTLMEF